MVAETRNLYEEKWPNILQAIKKQSMKLCSIEGLYKRLPITEWLPRYKRSYLIKDFVAGLTVGFTVIPHGIADAALAGLPPQYGLYAGFMGLLCSTIVIKHKEVCFQVVSCIYFLVQQKISQSDQLPFCRS